MNEFDTLPDGSLLFKKPLENLTNKYYRQDPDNPCRMIPVWPLCTRRVIHLRVLNCGLKRGKYSCDKFHKQVTFTDCESCDAKEPGQQPS